MGDYKLKITHLSLKSPVTPCHVCSATPICPLTLTLALVGRQVSARAAEEEEDRAVQHHPEAQGRRPCHPGGTQVAPWRAPGSHRYHHRPLARSSKHDRNQHQHHTLSCR